MRSSFLIIRAGGARLAVCLAVFSGLFATAACTLPSPALAASPLSWSAPVLPAGVDGVGHIACPSTALCVGPATFYDSGTSTTESKVVSSTNPTGGAGAWSLSTFTDPNLQLGQISCASSSLCVMGEDYYGSILASTDPTGGATAWTSTALGSGYSPQGLSCPTVSLCVAGDGHGGIYTSSDPGNSTPIWSGRVTVGGYDDWFNSISCPATSSTTVICVAVSSQGNAAISTDPTGGVLAWKVVSVDAGNNVRGVSCPSAVLCVGVDNHGNVVTFDPAGPLNLAVTQIDTNPDGNRLNAIACPTTELCVAVGDQGVAITSTNPTGGASAWSSTVADSHFAPTIVSVSCASTSLCVASDSNGLLVAGPAARHTLSVMRSGTGIGSVTGAGIVCPSICSASYVAGTQVTLTATPAHGSVFAGWSGSGCSGNISTCRVTMNADQTVTATFKPGPPPDTQITKFRLSKHKATVTFGFKGVGGAGGLHFKCKLDRRVWARCRSSTTYKHLRKGHHRFSVKAIDAVGQVDPTPATKRFKIG